MPRPDVLSAALRHARDAVHLATAGPHCSPEQAWHLAGFAVECTRKAALDRRTFDRALGHDLPPHLVDLALSLERPGRRLPAALPELAGWRVEHRYLPTGAPLPGDPVAAAEAADRMVMGVVATLWADGLLTRIPH